LGNIVGEKVSGFSAGEEGFRVENRGFRVQCSGKNGSGSKTEVSGFSVQERRVQGERAPRWR
jgi:hypothetical protein